MSVWRGPEHSYDLTTFAKCAFADAWREHEEQAARQRQGARTDLQLDGNSSIKSGRNPEQPSRDKIGERVGVSGRSVDKFRDVKEYAPPEVKQRAMNGEISLEEAHREANKMLSQGWHKLVSEWV